MARFDYNRRCEQFLVRQPALVANLAARAKAGETQAIRLATPVSRRFADGIDSTAGIDTRGAVGRVNANWWGSLFVEFGTRTQPPHPILRQTLDSMVGRR